MEIYNRHSFRLEITSLEEFAAFVAIIRGSNLDDPKLLELTAKLQKSTKQLSDAEKANAKHSGAT